MLNSDFFHSICSYMCEGQVLIYVEPVVVVLLVY